MAKAYNLSPAIIWNGIYDVAEMHKAKIKRENENTALIETQMYKIKTTYTFNVQPITGGGASVMMQTEGVGEAEERGIRLMLSALDSFLDSFS